MIIRKLNNMPFCGLDTVRDCFLCLENGKRVNPAYQPLLSLEHFIHEVNLFFFFYVLVCLCCYLNVILSRCLE